MYQSGQPAVVVEDLVKVFPQSKGESLRAVDGVSFQVESGEVFGFLGPNGAGKTTTLEIIEGIQEPTSGRVHILGLDVSTDLELIKPRIGVQLQAESFFERLHLDEILDIYGNFYNMTVDPGVLLERVGLTEKRKSFLKQLSGGQHRRFSIAVSLVSDPEVIFLDEPTSGLDPQARRNLWDLVEAMRAEGKTVVLTTHYMDEAETLCDRVAIIDHGKIRAMDQPLKLIQALDTAYHVRFTTSAPVDEEALLALPGAAGLTQSDSNGSPRYDLQVHNPADVLAKFARILGKKVQVEDLRVEPSTLEEVFLDLTGRELRD